MPRTVTYYYPDGSNPSAMKIFQDRSSQIRGYNFKRAFLNQISKEEYATNYAVYFLFGSLDNKVDKMQLYVGQSKLGANRISHHIKNKDFWDNCIMFVSDNNIFDASAIDYMEYYFINLLKNSNKYELTNVDQRSNEPNLNYFDKITYQTYLSQILFLLSAEGVELSELNNHTSEHKKEDSSGNKDSESKPQRCNGNIYYVSNKRFKASVQYKNGDFYLLKDSIIHKPKESMLEWTDKGKHYYRIMNVFNEQLTNESIENIDNETYLVIKDIPFTTPSGAGSFVRGGPVNGWKFFEGVEEVRLLNVL